MLRKIDCIRLHVPEIESTLGCYRDKLGLELIWKRSSSEAGLKMRDSDTELVSVTEQLDGAEWKRRRANKNLNFPCAHGIPDTQECERCDMEAVEDQSGKLRIHVQSALVFCLGFGALMFSVGFLMGHLLRRISQEISR